MIIADYIMLMHKRASVNHEATGKEIAYKLLTTGLPGLPVVNENMEISGIITAFDLLGNIREGKEMDKITAGQIMSKKPITAGIETTVEELIEIMLENNFTMIPIVKDNKIAGIVDRRSLLEAYVEPSLQRYFKQK
jgi:CBS domain-containing protein